MNKLYGKIIMNYEIYKQFREIGFDYILNPETGELHNVNSNMFGQHNLQNADMEKFIGLVNIGRIPAEQYNNGTILPIYDLETASLIGEYPLNKCQYCFSDSN